MLHLYGWRRDRGPFFLDNPRTLAEVFDVSDLVNLLIEAESKKAA